MYKIPFSPGARRGAYSAPPDPLAVFKTAYFYVREGEREKERKEEGKGREREEKGASSPFQGFRPSTAPAVDGNELKSVHG